MFWMLLFGVVGIALLAFVVFTLDDQGGMGILLFILCLVLGYLIANSNKIVVSDETIDHKLVAVNGYYVDNEGNYVTEDNIRSRISSIAIPEKSVTSVPYISVHKTVYKKTFFKFGGESMEYSLKLGAK